MFRKLTLTLCALVLMCTPVAAKTLVVAGNCAFPPMEFLTDKKVPTGYSIDYIHEIAKRANLKITFRDVAWDGIFAGLAAGNYDILASSTTITPERQQAFDFTIPYYGAVQAVVMPKGKKLDSLAGLKGLTVGKVTANAKTALDGEWPIARELYIFTDGEPKGGVKKLVDYLLAADKGQKDVLAVGYVPLQH